MFGRISWAGVPAPWVHSHPAATDSFQRRCCLPQPDPAKHTRFPCTHPATGPIRSPSVPFGAFLFRRFPPPAWLPRSCTRPGAMAPSGSRPIYRRSSVCARSCTRHKMLRCENMLRVCCWSFRRTRVTFRSASISWSSQAYVGASASFLIRALFLVALTF